MGYHSLDGLLGMYTCMLHTITNAELYICIFLIYFGTDTPSPLGGSSVTPEGGPCPKGGLGKLRGALGNERR